MIKIPRQVMIEKIKDKSGLSEAEINKRINDKLEELSGLISEEGAVHIVANELGIKLMEASNETLSIKSVFAGMRNIEILCKVTKIYEIRHFNSNGREGKVGSFMIGDSTGVSRVTAWGSQADNILKLKEGDTVRLKAGYAKENNGRVEIHLNDNSQIIINPQGETVGEVKTRQENTRKKISELSNQDQNVEILGTVVQAFDPRYFEVCPHCFKRIKQNEMGFVCDTHGSIQTPDFSYVMNVVIDDGSDSIRTIFFKNQMQHLISMTHEEILAKRNSSFEEVKNDLLGKIIKVIGKASTNQMFSRIEFVAQIVDSNPSADAELKRLEMEKGKTASYQPQKQEANVESKKSIIDELRESSKSAPKQEPKKAEKDVMSIDDLEEVSDEDIYE